jgi:hypothetical protein
MSKRIKPIRFTVAELTSLRMACNFALRRWPFPIACNPELEAAHTKIAKVVDSLTKEQWAEAFPRVKVAA